MFLDLDGSTSYLLGKFLFFLYPSPISYKFGLALSDTPYYLSNLLSYLLYNLEWSNLDST